jgi:hypothetical protein
VVARRLNHIAAEGSADYFLLASYIAESVIKTIGIALWAHLREQTPTHAYRVIFGAVHSDGIGAWDMAIRELTSSVVAGAVAPEMRPLVAWLTKRRTQMDELQYRSAFENAAEVLRLLGAEDSPSRRMASVRDLITAFVQIRNKTKGHGAVGPDFFAQANVSYIRSLAFLLETCPLFRWKWVTATSHGSEWHLVGLAGINSTAVVITEDMDTSSMRGGVNFVPDGTARAYSCAPLIQVSNESTVFWLPNGDFGAGGDAQFIDYASGETRRAELGQFVLPPAPLPPSETEGAGALDVQSNVFGNLPSIPKGYVSRPTLERELLDRLLDRNHVIITLHGRGGVGKTSLALYVTHFLADQSVPRFDHIVWFSARDVDLTPSGPKSVQPAVLQLADISRAYGALFGVDGSIEAFSRVLRESKTHSDTGLLFIFDNFETIVDATALHRFLDTHTHFPNKVLITSRERAFKADYPIEVRGMERSEAFDMMSLVAQELRISSILTEDVKEAIFEFTEGHAYVMRVVLGEIQKEGRYVPPRQLMTRRLDIVDAVFERSFRKLSDAGRAVFLLISNWRSVVSELALLVVLGRRLPEVEAGVEECVRLSLVARDEMVDGQACYAAPSLARLFGQKKLQGDPDRLILQEDLVTLRHFGVIDTKARERVGQEELIRQFIDWCKSETRPPIKANLVEIEHLVEAVAELWPSAWLELAEIRERIGRPTESVEYALRRAVEELPGHKEAWLRRAKYAEKVGDDASRISSLISAVDADPSDVLLVRDVAVELSKYLTSHKTDIQPTRRGVYVASVRAHMERLASRLDATGLSRLAWLFLLENDHVNALKYAELGARKEPGNPHCLGILERVKPRSSPKAPR